MTYPSSSFNKLDHVLENDKSLKKGSQSKPIWFNLDLSKT